MFQEKGKTEATPLKNDIARAGSMKGLGNQDTGGAPGGMGRLNLERSPGELPRLLGGPELRGAGSLGPKHEGSVKV